MARTSTSEGLSTNLSRIEDQVRKRGWDVRVVAPEWRRQSGLRLGNWRKALYRGKPATIALSSLPTGVGKAGVMRLMTNYFEGRRESMLDALGAQLLADVMGYQQHRDSVQAVLRSRAHQGGKGGERPAGPAGRAQPGRDRPRRSAR